MIKKAAFGLTLGLLIGLAFVGWLNLFIPLITR